MSDRQQPGRDISKLDELRASLLPLGVVAGLALLLAAASMVVAALGAGRSTSEPGPPPPAHEATPTEVATRPTPRPSRPPLPTASPRPSPGPHTIWLVDAQAGTALTLFEARADSRTDTSPLPPHVDANPIFYAAFDETQPDVVIAFWDEGQRQRMIHFALDGAETHRGDWTGIPFTGPVCRDPRSTGEGPVEVDGEPYEDVSCGPMSPDGRWMTYQVVTGADEIGSPIWDQWVVDLRTNERRLLQEGLRHCGGCGGVISPRWSPSGRYLYLADWIFEDGRIFLADVLTGTSRVIFAENAGTDYEPVWSPVADVLIYPGAGGTTVLEDLQVGSRIMLEDMRWPSTFDPTGDYLYSPAAVPRETPAGGTFILHLPSGTVSSVPGLSLVERSGPHFSQTSPAVVGVSDGFIAALERSTESTRCTGTVIFHPARAYTGHIPLALESICVERATWPRISPDGTKVALARATALGREIVIVDVSTGDVRSITGAVVVVLFGQERSFPDYFWNDAGTHLLVRGQQPGAP